MIELIRIFYECPKCNAISGARCGPRNITISEIAGEVKHQTCTSCKNAAFEPVHIICKIAKEPEEKEGMVFKWRCNQCKSTWHSAQSFSIKAIHSGCAKIMKNLAALGKITCPYGCKPVPKLLCYMRRGVKHYVD